MTNKGYLNFIIAFVLSIVVLASAANDLHTNLGWWFLLLSRLLGCVYLIWLVFTDKPRLPSILGIAAAVVLGIGYYVTMI